MDASLVERMYVMKSLLENTYLIQVKSFQSTFVPLIEVLTMDLDGIDIFHKIYWDQHAAKFQRATVKTCVKFTWETQF